MKPEAFCSQMGHLTAKYRKVRLFDCVESNNPGIIRRIVDRGRAYL